MADISRDILTVRSEGAVRVLTMTYPERRNAFSTAMRAALRAQFLRLMYEDAGCRAIVLTGAAGTFCAGGDLSELKPRPLIEARQVFETPRDIVEAMVFGPKPVVAAVEGPAFGAGLSLACACDYVVAAANARFCAAFIKVGLLPDTGILWTLPRRVGSGKAREMLLFATEVGGAEAWRIGLVDQLTDPGGALDTALAVAHDLAARPEWPLARVKSILHESSFSPDAVARLEIANAVQITNAIRTGKTPSPSGSRGAEA